LLVTVYTTPNCVACNSTKRQFQKLGVRYDEVALENHPELIDQFKEKGHIQAPIVVAGESIWSGYRHEKIQNLAAKFNRESNNK
jgi:glutaredoxin-like protein NrdH